MRTAGLKREADQLNSSIDKLLHYLAVYVKHDSIIRVYDGPAQIFFKRFTAPREISISGTLYTRLDDCHGAGNCCRVPFDLVYTEYDRQRIINYDYNKAADDFGFASAAKFLENKEALLDQLRPYDVWIEEHVRKGDIRSWHTMIYAQSNTEIFELSGKRSCPYLFMSTDRYYCGVHPFKPLHCWYPHMVVRATQPQNTMPSQTSNQWRPSVTIGRMQYGRNHKFGCPVLFSDTSGEETGVLFEDGVDDGHSYFDNQFDNDYDKLKWTSMSAQSMGFTSGNNFAVGLEESLSQKRTVI
ncbi:MAG: hypothetical protein CMB80_00815, partial [Flammeovirgaceae bacterium]|nr:hypothetical protein [Flammeovirgaceae bacterium]